MVHHLQIVLDPPPHGVYTYKDTVSGKVSFESNHEKKIGWIYVFFHGWANINVPTEDSSDSATTYRDKEVLFQNYQKVYEGSENLLKKVRYEWPFKFAFQAEKEDAAFLPTSGKYSYSSVEYKVYLAEGR